MTSSESVRPKGRRCRMHAPAADRLAPADEANLVLDHTGQVNVFLAALLVSPGGFVGADGVPDLAVLRSVLHGRIREMPALQDVPVVDGRRHRWTVAAPDLNHHIRLVDRVDGLAGLERLCAELMITPLERARPLWELLVVPLDRSDRVGMVLRMHHSIADGMAAVAVTEQLFDPSRVPMAGQQAVAEPVAPVRLPLRAALRRASFGLHRIALTLSGSGVGDTVLLGERDSHREVAFMSCDLAALKAAAGKRHVTVNDALLAAVSAGYCAAVMAAGEPVPEWLPVSVPVALRRRGASRNQVGIMLVRLPLDVPEPDDRLELIAAQTRVEKVRARGQGTLELMRGPLGAHVMDLLAKRQHVVAGFVTDIPGPRDRLFLAGSPVCAIWPVTVLAANVRLGVAAVSYAGRLYCGVHFDAKHVAGALFVSAMRDELARLSVAVVGERPRGQSLDSSGVN